MKNEHDSAIDLDAIRRLKRAAKRRKWMIIFLGIGLILLLLIWILVSQISQVLDNGKGFWGNFNSTQQTSSVTSS